MSNSHNEMILRSRDPKTGRFTGNIKVSNLMIRDEEAHVAIFNLSNLVNRLEQKLTNTFVLPFQFHLQGLEEFLNEPDAKADSFRQPLYHFYTDIIKV